MLKRLLPLSFIAGLLGALAFAVPASASANTYTANCTVSGTAHTNPNVLVIGGTGGYTFQPLHLQCAGRDVLDPSINEVIGVSVTSTGTYNNLVCGTGTADSGAGQNALAGTVPPLAGTSTAPGAALGVAIPGISYHIGFAGGQGVFGWGQLSSTQGSVPDPDPTAPPGSTFGGFVEITPSFDATSPPPPAGCTDHFTVTGSISGTYTG